MVAAYRNDGKETAEMQRVGKIHPSFYAHLLGVLLVRAAALYTFNNDS